MLDDLHNCNKNKITNGFSLPKNWKHCIANDSQAQVVAVIHASYPLARDLNGPVFRKKAQELNYLTIVLFRL